MQNSNSSNTTTTATNSANATETERPTLAELLAERAEERQQREVIRGQNNQRQREEERTKALDFVATWARSHISDDLREALRMTYAVDDTRLDDHCEDIYAFARAGFVTLDVSGSGIDDAGRDDPNRDERWRISNERSGYYSYWTLIGPNSYSVQIDIDDQHARTVDTPILDAIAAYPKWLVDIEDRRADAEQERIAAQVAEERARPIQYSNATVMLEAGYEHRHWIKVQMLHPHAEGGIMEYTGVINDYTASWILITTESGRQRLLNVAHVVQLLPMQTPPDTES